MSINDLPVGRSVDETLRLIKVSCDWRIKYFSLIGPDEEYYGHERCDWWKA